MYSRILLDEPDMEGSLVPSTSDAKTLKENYFRRFFNTNFVKKCSVVFNKIRYGCKKCTRINFKAAWFSMKMTFSGNKIHCFPQDRHQVLIEGVSAKPCWVKILSVFLFFCKSTRNFACHFQLNRKKSPCIFSAGLLFVFEILRIQNFGLGYPPKKSTHPDGSGRF